MSTSMYRSSPTWSSRAARSESRPLSLASPCLAAARTTPSATSPSVRSPPARTRPSPSVTHVRAPAARRSSPPSLESLPALPRRRSLKAHPFWHPADASCRRQGRERQGDRLPGVRRHHRQPWRESQRPLQAPPRVRARCGGGARVASRLRGVETGGRLIGRRRLERAPATSHLWRVGGARVACAAHAARRRMRHAPPRGGPGRLVGTRLPSL
mmetsp:Transcript_2932/g.8359  ORF Transcript_2932/g.8359 Transcript_2932/m.8359 type:complete len:213 (-) Transcript_2932:954-1592(-)